MAAIGSMTSFTPFFGPKTGVTYTLPPNQGNAKRVSHVNRLMNAMQERTELAGVSLTRGVLPLFPSYGEVQLILRYSPEWLKYQGYSATYAGLHNALADLSLYILGGGLGTFKQMLPTGSTFGTGGAAVTYRQCNAIITGDYTTEDHAGAPLSDVTITFMVPSCLWTYPEAQDVLPFV